jgi:hypothetical protein
MPLMKEELSKYTVLADPLVVGGLCPAARSTVVPLFPSKLAWSTCQKGGPRLVGQLAPNGESLLACLNKVFASPLV